ncbi:glycoside hydrolase [Sulfuriferula plumbiphila]|uniref:Glycoside hydrolase n=1 Tax=Sulfuriferula plumbiphila TaxID=171865 RepID=A0A512L830_9PROT|nr:glycosyltransferase family 4 protein [Sulfuriferula plumbiphila]BBP02832.1 glycoside hydrolase [Sulfuriferula plumbiphila]GEP30301.1 glycoside hydrolase [Sulfuriferula plumbiphila]
MPRYLVLTELFLPTKGGTAVWFAEVYRRLSGKETHIVTADVPGAAEVDAGHPNSVHRINMRRVPWLKPESLGMYVNLFAKSLWLALTHRFDAIHAGRALPEGLTAWLVARLTFHPVAIYAHGEELTTWGRGGKYQAMRFALRHADHVIANSEFTRDELIKMDVNPVRITLIYPGVDVTRFRPGLACGDLRQSVGVGAAGKLILSVGRLSRRKGFDQVIKSLPALVNAGLDVQYTLIGIGEDQDYLLSLAREHGVAERVHLLGQVSAADLPRWYNACDVFAMPNREINGDTEGFGMVFIEAAACGKPALAGQAGGTGAAVLDGVTGLQVDGTRLASVENALQQMLQSVNASAAMGQMGLARVLDDFSWEVVARKTAAMRHLNRG